MRSRHPCGTYRRLGATRPRLRRGESHRKARPPDRVASRPARGGRCRCRRVRHRARLWRFRGTARRSAGGSGHPYDHQAVAAERAYGGVVANRDRHQVDASIDRSLRALRRETLDCVLLHRAVHMTAFGGAVWKRLEHHLEEGTDKGAGRFGAVTEGSAGRTRASQEFEHLQLAVQYPRLALGGGRCHRGNPEETSGHGPCA